MKITIEVKGDNLFQVQDFCKAIKSYITSKALNEDLEVSIITK